MTKIEEIKAKLNSVEKLNLNDNNTSTIKDIVFVLSGMDNSISEKECVDYLDSENAWNDLNEFMANNDCGEYWFDADVSNSKYYVYSY